MATSSFFYPVQQELRSLEHNLKAVAGTRHPILYAAAKHLFEAGGKRFRPALIFLVAKATAEDQEINTGQRRLAEITEIIHTASLVHDDIIDECKTRRGVITVHNVFTTKIAVLAGDFLFAQSSWYLANIGNLAVVKAMSKVITDFAEGEIRQGLVHFDPSVSIDAYIEKSFYKTASLIAAGCRGAAMLNGASNQTNNNLYLYGKHMGLAFQVMDDVLDVTGSTKSLGKPAGSDLSNGNLTSPVLFALTRETELNYLIQREFCSDMDISKALFLIKRSGGLTKAQDLAKEQVQAALYCLHFLPRSTSVSSLRELTHFIITRLS
uniref:Prenyl transferase n=1 Tax=Wildemania schizophylla TaxID=1134705 RepID=A0A126G486_WILSC|nr:prenyl transferase [Wildemania schizophylla]AKS28411.1 prenyl transferase [Wildemania schizophylla]